VNAVMNLRVPYSASILSSGFTTGVTSISVEFNTVSYLAK
jgi:hypothetical protein